MNNDELSSRDTRLERTSIGRWQGEWSIATEGAILLCRRGEADIHIGLRKWHIFPQSTITLFPNDAVCLENATDDFEVELLRYSADLLREASFQLEHTIYSRMRADRCFGVGETTMPTRIVESLFQTLRIYFGQSECLCLDQLVVLQLKTYFLGFYEWQKRTQPDDQYEKGTRRMNEILHAFMELMESDFRTSHRVDYYADRLHITPKYLSNITTAITGFTPKELIDHYLILQIKQTLRRGDKTVQQIAEEFCFSDASFFVRYFRHHTGVTPAEWRNRR